MIMLDPARESVLESSRKYYSSRAFYSDLLAQRQRSDRGTTREVDFLKWIFHTKAARPVKRVLDIACGGGRHVVALAQQGFDCTGYDLTKQRLEAAEARARRTGVRVVLKQADATRLPVQTRFDAVLALNILFLLPNDNDCQRCLNSISKALSRGGVLVCNIDNPFTTGKGWLAELRKTGNYVSESRARGIRMTEIQKLRDFDPVRGAAWIEETTLVEAPDGKHVFRDKERVRFFTYWDIFHYLRKAGFEAIFHYPDWKKDSKKESKAEELVFVARK